MMKCPNCKDELPALSKVCPRCGYVVNGEQNVPSLDDFANLLEKQLYELKSIPQPSFGRSMAQFSYIMFPILAIYMLVVALISHAGLFWILFILFGILAVVSIIKKAKGNLGNDPFNRIFLTLRNQYEYNERIGKRYFGKNIEVARLLEDISKQISDLELQRSASNRKNLFAWIILLILVLAIGGTGIFSVNKALNPETIAEKASSLNSLLTAGKWEDAVAIFKQTISGNEYESNKTAKEILPVILKAGETQKAKDFFLNECMGRIGDYDCAALIVQHYTKNNDPNSARDFIKLCSSMRYKSDQKKLEKLLTDK